MGQTIKKIVDELREELSGFRMSDDSLLPDYEYFIDKINEYRGSVLREMDYIPEGMYTSSCCNEIKCVGQQCTLNGMVFISKTKLYQVTVPDLIDGIGFKDILYLGLDGFRQDFSRVSLSQFSRSMYSEFGSNEPIYVKIGQTVLLKNLPSESLTFLCITALQLNPTDSCSYEAGDAYPASENILSRVKRLVKMDVLAALGYPKDFISDALPALSQPTQTNESEKGN